jgi:hypothetical protein
MSKTTEIAVQPMRHDTRSATATWPEPRPVDCQPRIVSRPVAAAAAKSTNAISGIAATAMIRALAIRKQPDHIHAIGDEMEPSTPSLA